MDRMRAQFRPAFKPDRGNNRIHRRGKRGGLQRTGASFISRQAQICPVVTSKCENVIWRNEKPALPADYRTHALPGVVGYNSRFTMPSRFTLNDLRNARVTGKRAAMLTCYDFTTARLLDGIGVDMLLVGDSAAGVMLGHETTLPVSLDYMIAITAAVRRGASRAMVMGDMPFGSYHASAAQGVKNVCRMVKETNCDCVKIEAAAGHVKLIEKLVDAGVGVVAHIGLRPQAVGLLGGYRAQGKTAADAQGLVELAVRLARGGAAALLVEAVPPEVSQRMVESVAIPVIGCGAGPACHGHVVVLQDLLRQTPTQPRFVPTVNSGTLIEMASQYVTQVRSGAYPSKAHCYDMPEEQRALFAAPGVLV
jgi:3-methyl-2-oxobutanoate hydroxymethyltransferase